MTKAITKTMQLVLAIGMTGGFMATAQQMVSGAIPSIAGADLQLNITANVHAQVKDDLFAGAEKFAQGASEVTEINLDPSTMSMIGRGTPFSPNAQLASKMNFMVIHSYKFDKPGMYSLDDFNTYSKKLTDGTWNCLVHIRSKSGSSDICSRTAADHETNEMVILTAEPSELKFIHMSGKMSLADLNRMSGESRGMLLPGLEPDPKVLTFKPLTFPELQERLQQQTQKAEQQAQKDALMAGKKQRDPSPAAPASPVPPAAAH